MTNRKVLAIWIPAAIGAVALHLACVGLVYANLPQEDADDLGAPAFEVGLDLLSPRTDATDLPPGPESDASAAAPAQVEQKEKEEETALPQEKPTEAEEPDRIVAETAPKKPTEEEQKVAAHLERFKRYPTTGVPRSTRIEVGFTLDRLGHVVSAEIRQGSGDPAFDQAALAMLRRADPVPPPPPLVADDGLSFTLPVVYRVKGKS
jgi:protein TonB